MVHGKQALFLAVTFLVMVAIIYLSKDLTSALLVISLLTNFLIISSQLTLISERHEMTHDGRAQAAGVSPDMTALALATAGDDGFVDESHPRRDRFEPGGDGGSGPHTAPGGLDPGFVSSVVAGLEAGPDLDAGDLSGNLYSGCEPEPGRAPLAAGAGGGPGWAGAASGWGGPARATFDGDRLAAEHGIWRNDGRRVAAGIMRRKDVVDRYMAEELDEEEHKPWWGRAEA